MTRRRRALALPIAFAVVLAAALGGACSSSSGDEDPCEKMLMHLQACGFSGGSGGGFNCTGAAACAADCLTNASCAELKTGKPFTDCPESCQPSP